MPHLKETVEIHNEMLELLRRFHNICMENDIKYTLDGGTLLGAIREKGFIPWDDDIDVSLTRNEYEKLCNVIEKMHLEGDFTFDRYSNKVSEFWLKREDHVKVWLDIYIFDYISEIDFMKKIKILFLTALTAFTKTKKTIEFSNQRKKQRKLWQVIIFKFFYILGKPFKQEQKIRFYQWFSKNCILGKKKYIHRSNDEYIGLSWIFEKNVMNDYRMVKFEEIDLMISSAYDDMLRTSYGNDYMIPKRESEADEAVHKLVKSM